MGLFDKFKKKTGTAPTPKTIRISDFIQEKSIAFFPSGPSKRQVFGNLIGSLDLDDPGAALKSIMAREEAGSTVITSGVALPHARLSGLTNIRAAIGICPTGIEYSRREGDLVQLVVLFVGPAENMRLHLAFLAQVAALFQKQDFCGNLLKSMSASAALKIIRDAEKSL
jgi:mannitol/fructose-specific phosphotransferase system IIA component (Ntr-type)